MYDPRKDSTYAGGSGAHRLADASTWDYTENPHIAALHWALGKYENGHKVYGIGADISEIDVGAFIAGANVSDANGWKLGGQITTTDDKFAVLTTILQAGGAIPIARGAHISCLTNTPIAAAFTIRRDDVVGEVEISNTTSLRDRHNSVIPTYREETQNWQMIQGENVSSAVYVSEDNGKPKTLEVEYPFVQQAAQAHQLATYDLVNSREFLTFTMQLKHRALELRVGDACYVDIDEIAARNQKCVVVQREFNPADFSLILTLKSETDAKHAFALGQSQVAPPSPQLRGFNALTPDAPSTAAWTITGTTLGNASQDIPAIVISGENDNPYTADILVEYRPTGSLGWIDGGSYSAATTRIEITGVTSGTQYEVAISYLTVAGARSDRLIFSPVTAGIAAFNFALINGATKPDPNATNSRLLTSPFGTSTVGTTINTLTNYGARIQTVENVTTNGTFAQASRVSTLEARTTTTFPNSVINGNFQSGGRAWNNYSGTPNYSTGTGWVGTYMSFNGADAALIYQDVPINAGITYYISGEGDADVSSYINFEYLTASKSGMNAYSEAVYLNGAGFTRRGNANGTLAPAGAIWARVYLNKTAGGSVAYFTRIALQANGWTVWRDDTTPIDTLARISTVETATVDGRFATASRAQTLEAQMAGSLGSNLNSRISGLETVTSNGTFSSASRTTTLESLAVVPKSGEVNPNADFSTWTDGYVYPNNWGQWAAQRIIPTNGLNGRRYAPRQDTVANENAGIANGALYKQRGWYVIEVDARINGSFSGMGVGWYSGGEGLLVYCANDPDINGVVRGASENPFWAYSWRKLVYSSQEDYGAVVYGFAAYDGLGSIASPRSVIWDRIAVRRATDGEIAGKKAYEGLTSKADISYVQQTAAGLDYARANLETSVNARLNRAQDSPLYAYVREVSGVSVNAQNVANDARGRTNAFWGITADAGNGRAQITAYADGYGGVVDLVGNVRIHGNLTIDGTVSTGKLANNSVTVPVAVSASNYVYGAYTNVQLLEVYVDMGGSSGWIYANSTLRQSYSGGASAWNIYLLIDGNVVAYTGGGAGYSDSVAISGSAQVDGGVHHVEILCNSSSNIHYESRTLFAMGVKK